MSITVSVVTTANRTRRFKLEDGEDIQRMLNSLKYSASIFTGKPLIIGSTAQTEIFAATAIACIELETTSDLSSYLPSFQTPTITALTTKESIAPFAGKLEDNNVRSRLDFFFKGGHVLNTEIEGERNEALAERLSNLTSIFERPVISYLLPQGGIGLMNPQAMIRSVITPGAPDLPLDAWIADPV